MSGVDFPVLEPDQEKRISELAHEWARLHPAPEVPVLLMMDGSELTPRSIADAFDYPDTPRGQTVRRMFAVALHSPEKRMILSFDEILSHFEHDISMWRGTPVG
jgi:hypothetical protein